MQSACARDQRLESLRAQLERGTYVLAPLAIARALVALGLLRLSAAAS